MQIPFFSWMLLGGPTVAILFVVLFLTLRALSPAGVAVLPGGASVARDGLAGLGAWRRGERSVLWAFLVTVVLWITPGVLAVVLGEPAPLTLAVQPALPDGLLTKPTLVWKVTAEKGGARRCRTSDKTRPLYTSDAAHDGPNVVLGGGRQIKQK